MSELEAPRARMRKSRKTTEDDPRRVVQIRMKQSDYDTLRFNARKAGKTMSLYLTDCMVPPVEQVNAEELRELLAELRVLNRQVQGEATNINQMAHWANAQSEFPQEAEECAALLRRQVVRINALRIQIGDLL